MCSQTLLVRYLLELQLFFTISFMDDPPQIAGIKDRNVYFALLAQNIMYHLVYTHTHSHTLLRRYHNAFSNNSNYIDNMYFYVTMYVLLGSIGSIRRILCVVAIEVQYTLSLLTSFNLFIFTTLMWDGCAI